MSEHIYITVRFSLPPAGVQHSALPGRSFTVKYNLVPKKLLSSFFSESFRVQTRAKHVLITSKVSVSRPAARDLPVGCFCLFLLVTVES